MKKLFKNKKFKKNKHKFSLLSLLVIFSCSIFFLYYKYFLIPQHRITEYKNAYNINLSQDAIKIFQDLFVKDIRSGINDDYTKSNAYFLIHRYFDNGGDIYEITNYINEHKELSFLKEVETIYPEIFEDIKNRRLPFTYSDKGMYTYLAYLEVLDRHAYSNIATLGSLTGQYAKMGYYKKMILDDKSKGLSLNYPNYTKSDIDKDITKALFFEKKTDVVVSAAITNTQILKDTSPQDILSGVTQYASGLRYLDALGVVISPTESSQDVFSFAVKYSYTNYKEMYLSTALLNATTLTLKQSSKNYEIKNALYPFFDLTSKQNNATGLVYKVLQSKYQKSESRFRDLDIYSKENIIKLAKLVSNFKNWLIINGWNEKDFK